MTEPKRCKWCGAAHGRDFCSFPSRCERLYKKHGKSKAELHKDKPTV